MSRGITGGCQSVDLVEKNGTMPRKSEHEQERDHAPRGQARVWAWGTGPGGKETGWAQYFLQYHLTPGTPRSNENPPPAYRLGKNLLVARLGAA